MSLPGIHSPLSRNVVRGLLFLWLLMFGREESSVSCVSLGRLFPASRSRQRANDILSQTIAGSFYPNPDKFEKSRYKTRTPVKPLSLPQFPDVVWKFNKNFVKKKNSEYIGTPSQKHVEDALNLKNQYQELKKLFDQYAQEDEEKNPSRLKRPVASHHYLSKERIQPPTVQRFTHNNKPGKGHLNISNVFKDDLEKGTSKYKFQGGEDLVTNQTPQDPANLVTNSPIYYIKLPAKPYEYHPDLGYISRPARPSMNNFIRPQVNFVNNGRPSFIYQPTIRPPTEQVMVPTTDPPSYQKPTISVPNSPTKWLNGPYRFNGKPTNLFIFPSEHKKEENFDNLHNFYSKPGNYLR